MVSFIDENNHDLSYSYFDWHWTFIDIYKMFGWISISTSSPISCEEWSDGLYLYTNTTTNEYNQEFITAWVPDWSMVDPRYVNNITSNECMFCGESWGACSYKYGWEIWNGEQEQQSFVNKSIVTEYGTTFNNCSRWYNSRAACKEWQLDENTDTVSCQQWGYGIQDESVWNSWSYSTSETTWDVSCTESNINKWFDCSDSKYNIENSRNSGFGNESTNLDHTCNSDCSTANCRYCLNDSWTQWIQGYSYGQDSTQRCQGQWFDESFYQSDCASCSIVSNTSTGNFTTCLSWNEDLVKRTITNSEGQETIECLTSCEK